MVKASDASESVVPSNPLEKLEKDYGRFSEIVNSKKVLDFGCGNGFQSVAMANKFSAQVFGLDTNEATLKRASKYASVNAPENGGVEFLTKIPDERLGTFDVVISQNSMEHFPQPKEIVDFMKSTIHDKGLILITFGPPWFAPYGSHMHFFCRFPWINVLFSERTVMKVREKYRNDGAKHYTEVESGLNKMSVSKFEKILNLSLIHI